ncbi:hypothetical protein [Mycolicibacter minnesotensis]
MALAVAALVLPACSHTVNGTATTKLTPLDAALDGVTPADPVPTDNPLEGYLPNGGKVRTREYSHAASMDEAVQNTVAFWRSKGLSLTVRTEAAPSPLTCEKTMFPTAHAVRCDDISTIKYDMDWEHSLLTDPPYGAVALEITAAHEVGHAIQAARGFSGDLHDAPLVGSTNAAETSADCLAGFALAAKGVPTADLDKALPLTALGGTAVREEAFHEGMTTTDFKSCVNKYLG